VTEIVRTEIEFWDAETGQLMCRKAVNNDVIKIGYDVVFDFNAPSAPSDVSEPELTGVLKMAAMFK